MTLTGTGPVFTTADLATVSIDQTGKFVEVLAPGADTRKKRKVRRRRRK